MKLIQVKGNTWYLEGTQLIPLYRLDERRCILLDSGWHWEREKLREALEREKLIPLGVLGSHAHPDHAGNHRWLQEACGACICMSAGEAARAGTLGMCKTLYKTLSPNTVLERIGRDFVFQADRVLGPEDGVVDFLGVPFRIHHTPGHSPDHICIGTPDGVCHAGDLLLSERVIHAVQMPYHEIQHMARAGMEKMRGVKGYTDYIVAHKAVIKNLSAAVDENLMRMDWVCERFLELMEEPVTWEQLMLQVLERNQLSGDDEFKMAGYENIVQSYVDALKDDGRIEVTVDRGIFRFHRR